MSGGKREREREREKEKRKRKKKLKLNKEKRKITNICVTRISNNGAIITFETCN
jgi:hypothetical protein